MRRIPPSFQRVTQAGAHKAVCNTSCASPWVTCWKRGREHVHRLYSKKKLQLFVFHPPVGLDTLIDHFLFLLFFYFILCACVSSYPCLFFANHGRSARTSRPKTRKVNRRERERERERERDFETKSFARSTRAFGLWTESNVYSFLSASVLTSPKHVHRRKGGRTSSILTCVSDGCFDITFQAFWEAASVLAFSFEIIEEGPSRLLPRAKVFQNYRSPFVMENEFADWNVLVCSNRGGHSVSKIRKLSQVFIASQNFCRKQT